jgi:hypothetical protein
MVVRVSSAVTTRIMSLALWPNLILRITVAECGFVIALDTCVALILGAGLVSCVTAATASVA